MINRSGRAVGQHSHGRWRGSWQPRPLGETTSLPAGSALWWLLALFLDNISQHALHSQCGCWLSSWTSLPQVSALWSLLALFLGLGVGAKLARKGLPAMSWHWQALPKSFFPKELLLSLWLLLGYYMPGSVCYYFFAKNIF